MLRALNVCTALALSWSLPPKAESRQINCIGSASATAFISSLVTASARQIKRPPSAMEKMVSRGDAEVAEKELGEEFKEEKVAFSLPSFPVSFSLCVSASLRDNFPSL